MSEFSKKVIDIPEEYLPKIEDLPGELSRIAAVIERRYPGLGVPITLLLAQAFPGQGIYLHNVRALERAVRDDILRVRYDRGVRLKDLATETGLCTRHVERILARALGRKKVDKQMQMW